MNELQVSAHRPSKMFKDGYWLLSPFSSAQRPPGSGKFCSGSLVCNPGSTVFRRHPVGYCWLHEVPPRGCRLSSVSRVSLQLVVQVDRCSKATSVLLLDTRFTQSRKTFAVQLQPRRAPLRKVYITKLFIARNLKVACKVELPPYFETCELNYGTMRGQHLRNHCAILKSAVTPCSLGILSSSVFSLYVVSSSLQLARSARVSFELIAVGRRFCLQHDC